MLYFNYSCAAVAIIAGLSPLYLSLESNRRQMAGTSLHLHLSPYQDGLCVPPQVFVSCNFCGKSISYSCAAMPHQGRGFSQYGVSGSPTKSKVTSCPGCRKPLPRCALCLMNMGTPVSSCAGDDHGRISAVVGHEFNVDSMVCVLCFLAGTGKSDDKVDLTRENKLAQFNNWFTWCHNCRHGGHAGHMLSWFR